MREGAGGKYGDAIAEEGALFCAGLQVMRQMIGLSVSAGARPKDFARLLRSLFQ
jgi:hypothetical protein